VCGKLSERLNGCIFIHEEGSTRIVDRSTEESIDLRVVGPEAEPISIAHIRGGMRLAMTLGAAVEGPLEEEL